MEAFPDPRQAYQERLRAREEAAKALERREAWIANARLGVFLLAVAALVLVFVGPRLPWWVVLPPLATFVWLLVHHDGVIRRRDKARASFEYFKRALARLDGQWRGQGEAGEEFAEDRHPYAADLDLFGAGGLFELLCLARTKGGQESLAKWLLHPSDCDEILARHDAIEDIRNDVDLREDLAVLAQDVRAHVYPKALNAWATAPAIAFSPWVRGVTTVVAAAGALTLPSFVAGLFAGAELMPPPSAVFLSWGTFPFAVALVVNLVVFYVTKHRVEAVTEAVDEPLRDLNLLIEVLTRLEEQTFRSERLRSLQNELWIDGVSASRCIRRLRRLASALDATQNQIFAPFAFVLLWRPHIAFLVESWRRKYGSHIPNWLESVGELEAISSLAGYAYEHPADPFPEIVEDGPQFDGAALRHPLLPGCVPNDVRLERSKVDAAAPAIYIVSGSNMSGKSTLLRTVGTNAVLALTGAPVAAARLTLSRLAVGATLRIQDSIQDGESRFYAEILRLKQVVDLTKEETPVLFLLDEILHGTNSHDRLLGGRAVVQGLNKAGAIGLVTTHDLALTEIVNDLDRAENVHFVDHLENGKLKFDYTLRRGVVDKSNALDLMRSIGLEI